MGIKPPLSVFVSLLFATFAHTALALELKSPGGDLVLTFGVRDFGTERACPFYRLAYKCKEVLKDSRLGLDLEPSPLAANMSLAAEVRSEQDSVWKPICGERQAVRDHYNQLIVDLREAGPPQRLLRLTFRAYDEGIAFCYTLPAQDNLKDFTIGGEKTRFSFTADHTAWAVY